METILQTILGFFVQFAQNWPFLATLIAVMGTFRLFFKPLVTLIHAWVAASPSKKDDEILVKVESSGWYKAIMFIVDYIASVKLPEKKVPIAQAEQMKRRYK